MTDEDQATDETTRTSPADIFEGLIILAVAPSTLLWLLSFEWIAKWWLYIGFALVGITLVEVFISDNRELKIVRSENRQLFFLALLYWIPVAICIFPAIVLVSTVDAALESGVSSVEVWTHGAFQQSDTALQEKIEDLESKKYSWWWPPDYAKRAFDGYILMSLKKIRSDGVKQTSIVGRLFFLAVYFVLTVLQVTSWMVIGFLIFRSFMWIWVRTWLKEGGSVHFSLASSKV